MNFDAHVDNINNLQTMIFVSENELRCSCRKQQYSPNTEFCKRKWTFMPIGGPTGTQEQAAAAAISSQEPGPSHGLVRAPDPDAAGLKAEDFPLQEWDGRGGLWWDGAGVHKGKKLASLVDF